MEVRLDDIIVTKSGDSEGGENCNLYGQNAAILVKDGATATITNAQIMSTAKGASGAFSYGGSPIGKGDGTRLDIADSVITTTGVNSGGVMTTGGGETHVDNSTVNTSGESSSPIGSDQGGGTVVVDEGTYVSSGVDSPAVRSTGDITVKESTLISHSSSGLVIKGKHKMTLQDCVLTANNHKLPHKALQKCGIMLYDPDNTRGLAELSIKGGTINNISGHVLHVTNTKAKIVLNSVSINNSDSTNTLISVTNDGWGGSENNASVELRDMNVEGFILVDNEPTTEGHEGSVLDLTLASNTIYTGAINYAILPSHRGQVNLTIRQGSKFVLTRTSYIDSLVNNGKIVCGDYELYVNGEKYDDGGGVIPTESTLTLNGSTYAVKDKYGKIKVEQDDKTLAITATIKKSGQFNIKGNGDNTVIRIAKGVKDVILVLSDLTIDNSRYTRVTRKDSSVILFEPEASGKIVLKGASTLIGPNTYASLPRGIIRGNESVLVIDGTQGELKIEDMMPETTEFTDNYPDCINNYIGQTTFIGGTYRLRSNGSALRSAKGTINVDGATFLIEYSGQDAVNVDDGTFNMNSGRLDVSESNKTGISASSVEMSGRGLVNISGGEVRLYKIADSGIRGENILITGGTIDITNIYQGSADMIYVPGNDVVNKITIYPVNETTDKIRVNYKAGYHHGIEAGRRAKSYSYLSVPKTDPYHEVGVIYTQAASGSLNITGGTINIDTRITGIATNIMINPADWQPCSNNVYYVGAPGNGIMSYGVVAISGGDLTINAGGNGIECDGSIVINQEANVNIPLAYIGVKSADLVVGTDVSETAALKIDAMGTAVVMEGKTYTYTYDDSREEHNHYTIDTVLVEYANNFYNYGGDFRTRVDLAREVEVILRSGPGSTYTKKEFKYGCFGTGIDAKGYIYIDSGNVEIYGPDLPDQLPDMLPVKQNKGFLVNSPTTLVLTGVDEDDLAMPKYGSVVYVQTEEGVSWEAGSELKVDTTEGNPIYRGELPNSGSFFIFTHPEFVARQPYSITIGSKTYVLRAKETLYAGRPM